MLLNGYVMVSKFLLEDNYLYFGVGFMALILLLGATILSTNSTATKSEGNIHISIKTPEKSYVANVSEEKLFSQAPAQLFFSSIDNSNVSEQLQCTINCIINN